MEWIVTNGNGIVCSKDELDARREFIGMITGVSPSRWHIIVKDINNTFMSKCNTIDDINGLFITGHVGEVVEICKSPGIGKFDFVVANTCIWEDGYEKQILSELMHARQDIILWYAKQVVSLESGLALRKTNELENKGMFGFPTSKSERILFKNREKGFMNALKVAFDKVSAIYIA